VVFTVPDEVEVIAYQNKSEELQQFSTT